MSLYVCLRPRSTGRTYSTSRNQRSLDRFVIRLWVLLEKNSSNQTPKTNTHSPRTRALASVAPGSAHVSNANGSGPNPKPETLSPHQRAQTLANPTRARSARGQGPGGHGCNSLQQKPQSSKQVEKPRIAAVKYKDDLAQDRSTGFLETPAPIAKDRDTASRFQTQKDPAGRSTSCFQISSTG